MTPGVAAVIAGFVLFIAGTQNRNIVNVLLGRRDTNDYPVTAVPFGSMGTQNLNDLPSLSASPQTGSSSGDPISVIVSECNRIDALHSTYKYGGGHAGFSADGPWDCSGVWSYILHAAGLLKGVPLTSGLFASTWGVSGVGRNLTIWANAGHVFGIVNGRTFQTSRSNPGGGPGWTASRSTQGFRPRHIKGL